MNHERIDELRSLASLHANRQQFSPATIMADAVIELSEALSAERAAREAAERALQIVAVKWRGEVEELREQLEDAQIRASDEASKAASVAKDHRRTLEELAEVQQRVERLEQKVKLLHDATIVLRNGMGGHNHWDHTQQYGAGCETCIAQGKAREEATRLINDAAALTESEAKDGN